MFDDNEVRDIIMGLTGLVTSFIEVAIAVFDKEDFPYNEFGKEYAISGQQIVDLLESDDMKLLQFARTESSIDEIAEVGFPEIAANLAEHEVSNGYNDIELGMVYDEPSRKAIVFALLH